MNLSNLQMAQNLPDLNETQTDGQGGSLDEMVAKAFSDLDTKAATDKASINNAFADGDLSDPAKLIALQTQISNYNIFVGLASNLTNKVVSTVGTLVKAQ